MAGGMLRRHTQNNRLNGHKRDKNSAANDTGLANAKIWIKES